MNPPKSNRGGKRAGAGRKQRATPRVTISVKLEPEHADTFKALCRARSVSQSRQIADWIVDASSRKV